MIIHEERKIKGILHEVQLIDSISEAVDYAVENAKKYNSVREKIKTNKPKFTGRDDLETLGDVQKAVNSEWGKGLGIIKSMIHEVNSGVLIKPKNVRRRHRWDEFDGDEVCNDRLRSGQAFWNKLPKRLGSGPQRITLISEVGANADVKPDLILWRGAASVVLCDLLENAGYRVELKAVDHGSGQYRDRTNGLQVIQIKSLNSPLNLSSLTNAVSGWFYRTVIFGCEATSCKGRVCSGSLGKALKVEPSDTELLSHITPDQKAILISDIWNKQSALNLVRETIEKINSGCLITEKEKAYA